MQGKKQKCKVNGKGTPRRGRCKPRVLTRLKRRYHSTCKVVEDLSKLAKGTGILYHAAKVIWRIISVFFLFPG